MNRQQRRGAAKLPSGAPTAEAIRLFSLAVAQQRARRLAEAEALYRQALGLSPQFVEAHSNLGGALTELGRLPEAEVSCRRAVQLRPAFAPAHCNLGNIFRSAGRPKEAEAAYRAALQLDPAMVPALDGLARLLVETGDAKAALPFVNRSLAIAQTPDAKRAFAIAVRRLGGNIEDAATRVNLSQALTEPWCRPSLLMPATAGLVDVERADAPLLWAMLEAAPVAEVAAEKALTRSRRRALASALTGEGPAHLRFQAALARQCFINEYVWFADEEELAQVAELRRRICAAIDAGEPVPAAWLLAVASYAPLGALPCADRLTALSWPPEAAGLLDQQIREPALERALAADIPRLTPIEDEVSLLVQSQYEENPYPRWTRAEPAGRPVGVSDHLRQRFPLAPLRPLPPGAPTEILVAGCGTGQHPIETAQRFAGAHVLAIDLSRASLGYARRKAGELGLPIDFGQADLLKLAALGRTFDVIESGGVLHHLADPWAGWRALLAVLRPGGVMGLGFYSEAARQNVVRARAFIAANGYGSAPAEIVRCRRDIVEVAEREGFGSILRSPDFFSTSACRDLLFHVQEHRLNLKEIAGFLDENGLVFIGFEAEADVLRAYRRRFPGDPAATDLANWRAFEEETPDIFAAMYQFWVQKPGD